MLKSLNNGKPGNTDGLLLMIVDLRFDSDSDVGQGFEVSPVSDDSKFFTCVLKSKGTVPPVQKVGVRVSLVRL